MKRLEKYAAFIDEMTDFYDHYDDEGKRITTLLRASFDANRNAHPQKIKTELIRVLVEESAVHVFKNYPFFHQFSAGRVRKTWGGIGQETSGTFMFCQYGAEAAKYGDALKADRESGRIYCWNNPVGLDHHALNYDNILQCGIKGLRAQAVSYREKCEDSSKLPFYDAAIESLDCLKRLQDRFAEEAEKMVGEATNDDERRNCEMIAAAAKRVPYEPAETFHEALCAITFCREAVGTLEGIGISTYGQLDRMLYPYYSADLANGRITPDEAREMLEKLLCYTAIRFDENNDPGETSTTVILGGCDADGNVVYNEVTELFFRAELNVRVANVKYDCRVSKKHPQAYFDWIYRVQLAGLSMIVLMNDETHIAARVRHGQEERDARLYVAGGCHEIVLGGTEVCTRADTWIGLPAILLDTLKKRDYDNFDDLVKEAIADVQAFILKVEALKNEFERNWAVYGPMPLYSTMLTGCLESGKDAAAGGSKYASTALSMLAPATFIDSLWAVKTICFDEKRMSYHDFIEVVKNEFEGNEPFRQYIINRIPKHCSGNEELDAFTVRILHELSGTAGQTNGRGGKYYPAFYPHDIFRPLGYVTPATPDGRKKGFSLSRGVSPSEIISGITPAHMMRTVRAIDFTEFTDSFALEVTLPKLGEENGKAVLDGLTKEFLDAGGSTLQFNLFDADELRAAQEKPDEHRDLLVRVCGYSYYFVNLTREQQDEVIGRAVRY